MIPATIVTAYQSKHYSDWAKVFSEYGVEADIVHISRFNKNTSNKPVFLIRELVSHSESSRVKNIAKLCGSKFFVITKRTSLWDKTLVPILRSIDDSAESAKVETELISTDVPVIKTTPEETRALQAMVDRVRHEKTVSLGSFAAKEDIQSKTDTPTKPKRKFKTMANSPSIDDKEGALREYMRLVDSNATVKQIFESMKKFWVHRSLGSYGTVVSFAERTYERPDGPKFFKDWVDARGGVTLRIPSNSHSQNDEVSKPDSSSDTASPSGDRGSSHVKQTSRDKEISDLKQMLSLFEEENSKLKAENKDLQRKITSLTEELNNDKMKKVFSSVKGLVEMKLLEPAKAFDMLLKV